MARGAPFQRLLRTAHRRPLYLYVLVTACAGDQITGPTPHALPMPLSPTVRPCGSERRFFAGTTLAGTATSYADSSVAVGTAYEYQITKVTSTYNGYGYIQAGINAPLVEGRGKVLCQRRSDFDPVPG